MRKLKKHQALNLFLKRMKHYFQTKKAKFSETWIHKVFTRKLCLNYKRNQKMRQFLKL